MVRNEKNWLRAALLVLFLAESAIGAARLVQGGQTDFAAYLQAARELSQGHDPYLREPRYLYPPLVAVALVPVLPLPESAVTWLWVIASAAVMTSAIWLLAKDLRRSRVRLVAMAILFAPFAATQWNAQINAFVLAALVVARRSLDREEETLAGAALGFSIAIKPLALLPLGWLILTRRWRAAVTAVAVVAAAFFVAVPFLGWKGVLLSARHLQTILADSSPPDTYAANISLNGTLDRILGVPNSELRHIAVTVLVLTISLAAASLRVARASLAIDLLLSGTLLAAGSSWLHHSAVLFPLLTASDPATAATAIGLYAVAGGWQAAGQVLGGMGILAAGTAGTAALALLWLKALWRLLRPASATPRESTREDPRGCSSPASPV